MAEFDFLPTLEELSKAVDSLAYVKAPGNDAIPSEVLKVGKSFFFILLHEPLIQCWDEGSVLQDMRNAWIITQYKNKGDRNDCNNYRGILLISVVGKTFARVLLAERNFLETQCGFEAGRSTIEIIFSLRQPFILSASMALSSE